MLFRKPLTEKDFRITDNELIVRKTSFTLYRIQKLECKKRTLKDNLINILALALMLSAATWAFVPIAGPYVLLITLLLGFLGVKKYEFRAEYAATDESGDYWVTLANGCSEAELKVMQQQQQQLSHFLCLSESQ
ncbi:hypothetical protein [Vibrio sp. SCSIO 43137]|uniref:hypothetical protein n=1 Tax=Vibrio sp. SCSIO 43137 TaxID=3021011 RepID=UPI0023080EDE|nr:hypothetical protein [Vibrio sp. SCSIO 43137]WCE28873.1 hypothetical protein PK654_10940 [Vibrio sp. SCSIO 43137]